MRDDKLKNTRILTFLTFLLILLTGILSVYSVRNLNSNVHWTLHTKDVLQLSDELYASILETESNLRGYSLSSDARFISEYSNGKRGSLKILDSLQRLTTENNSQKFNFQKLRRDIEEKFRLSDSILAIVRVNETRRNPQIALIVIRGKEITQKIKDAISQINEEENSFLAKTNTGLHRNLNILPAILLFTTLIGVGAGALSLYSLYQYNKNKVEGDIRIADYQQQLKDQIQLLYESNKELEQFAYLASHDLQEPLRKIISFSDLLMEQYKSNLDGDGALYLERIHHSASRMRLLINDLLNYSRLSRLLPIEKIDLNAIIVAVKEDLEIPIKEKNATIEVSPLPVLTGNNSEFRQLFQNLISNSLKFSIQGTRPRISIVAEDASAEDLKYLPGYDISKQYLSIKLTDNGIGFNQEYADKIFIIFQRLHGRNEYEGTGIGLAICKKITVKYGGTIFAQSSPGKGTTFVILLPKMGSSAESFL